MPDVTWIPVSEPPPEDDLYYACGPEEDGYITVIVVRAYVVNGRVMAWVDAYNGLPYMPDALTHWAHMVYPPPPVEA